MKFLPDSPEIPQALIDEVTAGKVTFLCGAGVSCRIRLPLFKDLTDLIYREMGENWNNEAAERHAYVRDQFDRVLRSLEKRTHRPGAKSRVRQAVATHLRLPAGPYPAHLSLLHLSRDSEGRPRLMTTNFETGFERAAAGDGGYKGVPSHALRALPRPGTENDYGILHLHGRLADDTLHLEAGDLVLTSADFGDAYIRDGWASQYIEDRMRIGPMVLVGYSAEDAALRLLLETLDADRDRFPDLKPVYALELETPDSKSIWRAKGITAIEFASHDSLYGTLTEWAKYSLNPADYKAAGIDAILNPRGAP